MALRAGGDFSGSGESTAFFGRAVADHCAAAVDTRDQLFARLSRLGPVLLVRRDALDGASTWRLSASIDSDGVREVLQVRDWRLYRLPDSDYLGWERVVADLDEAPRVHETDRTRRAWSTTSAEAEPSHCVARASLARAGRSGWLPVKRVSALGWDVTAQILRIEAATLCAAAWSEPPS